MFKDYFDSTEFVKQFDQEVGEAMGLELARQRGNIELIASENFVSPAVMAAMGSVLTNKFKYYMNETLVSYVTKQKIHYACTLLRSSDQSILDIAEAAHYDSLSHFNHTFKKHIGLSPSDYRKKHIF